jgi:hypothetical protein
LSTVAARNVLGASVPIRIETLALAYCAAENCEYPTIASFSELTPIDG